MFSIQVTFKPGLFTYNLHTEYSGCIKTIITAELGAVASSAAPDHRLRKVTKGEICLTKSLTSDARLKLYTDWISSLLFGNIQFKPDFKFHFFRPSSFSRLKSRCTYFFPEHDHRVLILQTWNHVPVRLLRERNFELVENVNIYRNYWRSFSNYTSYKAVVCLLHVAIQIANMENFLWFNRFWAGIQK